MLLLPLHVSAIITSLLLICEAAAFIHVRVPLNALLTRKRQHHQNSYGHQVVPSLAQTEQRRHHQSTRLSFNSRNDGNDFNFNVTSSSSSYDIIAQTADILAKRIVHRGFATMGQQLRTKQRQQRQQQQQDQNQNPPKQSPQTKKVENAQKRLELQWTIHEINHPENPQEQNDILSSSSPCETCRTKGHIPCQFCKGNGYVDFGYQDQGTVGGRMTRDNNGHAGIECPVCDENGEQGCHECNGSGWIAQWRKMGPM